MGAPYATLAGFDPDSLHVTKGEENLVSHTTGKEERFSCKLCSSKVFFYGMTRIDEYIVTPLPSLSRFVVRCTPTCITCTTRLSTMTISPVQTTGQMESLPFDPAFTSSTPGDQKDSARAVFFRPGLMFVPFFPFFAAATQT
jgi:hypothetical protein